MLTQCMGVEDQLKAMSGSSVFTVLDLTKVYCQIKLLVIQRKNSVFVSKRIISVEIPSYVDVKL